MIETPDDFREARRTMGLSTYELADLLGLGPTTERGASSVRKIEAGTWRLTGPICGLTQALLDGWRPSTGKAER